MLAAMPETPDTADLMALLMSAGADPNMAAEECSGLHDATPLHISTIRCRFAV